MDNEQKVPPAGQQMGAPPPGYPYQGVPPQGYPPHGGYPPQGYYGMPPPYWGPQKPRLPPHPKAVPGMVLGIISLGLNFVSLMLVGACGPAAFITVIASIVLGIIAMVFGRKAKREIDAEPDRFGGEGQAQAAFITGLIGVIVAGLMFLAGIAFTVLLFVLFFYFP